MSSRHKVSTSYVNNKQFVYFIDKINITPLHSKTNKPQRRYRNNIKNYRTVRMLENTNFQFYAMLNFAGQLAGKPTRWQVDWYGQGISLRDESTLFYTVL